MSDFRLETIGAALAYARSLAAGDSLTATTAQALLGDLLNKNRAFILAHQDETLTPEQSQNYIEVAERAAKGEPLAYLIGYRDFFGHSLRVSPSVLIPRPETEAIVEQAIEWAAENLRETYKIVDVGTGSGAIAIALGSRLPQAQIIAVDISREALSLARQNADTQERPLHIEVVQGNLLESLPGPFDIILANLPYINREEIAALDVGRWEPHIALDGGHDGLVLIRQLLAQAPSRLKRPGLLALEFGADQGQRVCVLCQEAFPDSKVDLLTDLSGMDRIVTVQLT